MRASPDKTHPRPPNIAAEIPFYFLLLCASSVPILLLFDSRGFYDDWYNNLWFVGYLGEYFRRHFSFPLVINSHQILGITVPIFYAYTLYPVLGFLSSFMGGNLAVRFTLFVLYAAKMTVAYTFINKIIRSRAISFMVGCLVVWAIYPLTN